MRSYFDLCLICAVFLLPAVPAYFLKDKVSDKVSEAQKAVNPWIKPLNFFEDKKFIWIDARSPEKFNKKHIPDAVNLSQYNWEQGLMTLFNTYAFNQNPAAIMLVVYCSKGCHDSEAVAVRLREELPSENVYILEGGMEKWFEKYAGSDNR